jgi:hypothetical protein
MLPDPPHWNSEIVSFKNEWRYYVANGEVLAAHWYLGEDDEAPPPELPDIFPKNFTGAVDFGDYCGKLTLVENNLPYACGWYGRFDPIYRDWLVAGFEYIQKLNNV